MQNIHLNWPNATNTEVKTRKPNDNVLCRVHCNETNFTFIWSTCTLVYISTHQFAKAGLVRSLENKCHWEGKCLVFFTSYYYGNIRWRHCVETIVCCKRPCKRRLVYSLQIWRHEHLTICKQTVLKCYETPNLCFRSTGYLLFTHIACQILLNLAKKQEANELCNNIQQTLNIVLHKVCPEHKHTIDLMKHNDTLESS